MFPQGSIFVTHKPKNSGDSSDPATCSFRYWERGRYWVTGGTGAYAGAEGHGHYAVKVRGGGCDPNSPPETLIVQIHASGPLQL